MSAFYIPMKGPGDWKCLIEKPQMYWKTGQAPRALAHCWQGAKGFPSSVRGVFERSGIRLFQNIKFILAFPEYKIPLPPRGSHPSQNDIFVLARSDKELITIMVDGKASEPFGKTVAGWRKDHSPEKHKRLIFLCNELQLKHQEVEHIRYQLLHRTVSLLTEAERFNSKNALLLVHSFSQSDAWFAEFQKFLMLYDIRGKPGFLAFARNINGINLYFGWARGEERYLHI